MGNQILSMVLDTIMAGLLLATIIYCLKLNSRIRVLQDSKSELAQIIREFDESTTRATHNINEIHAATNRISENIQMKIDKANFLANDLEMLIERSNKMVGKVEVPSARTGQTASPQRSMADIMPARVAETVRATTGAEHESVDATRRPLRMRSRAEQVLINLIGEKKQNDGG